MTLNPDGMEEKFQALRKELQCPENYWKLHVYQMSYITRIETELIKAREEIAKLKRFPDACPCQELTENDRLKEELDKANEELESLKKDAKSWRETYSELELHKETLYQERCNNDYLRERIKELEQGLEDEIYYAIDP